MKIHISEELYFAQGNVAFTFIPCYCGLLFHDFYITITKKHRNNQIKTEREEFLLSFSLGPQPIQDIFFNNVIARILLHDNPKQTVISQTNILILFHS